MKEYFDYPIFIIMLNLNTKAHEVFFNNYLLLRFMKQKTTKFFNDQKLKTIRKNILGLFMELRHTIFILYFTYFPLKCIKQSFLFFY